MENLWNDLCYAWRMLIKSPGFSIVAVLALGLAIGANTSIFSLFNGVMWRPLPVKDPQELVVVATKQRGLDFPIPLSYPDFQDYRQLKAVFSDMIGYVPDPVNLQAGGGADARLGGTRYRQLFFDARAGGGSRSHLRR
jgi:hypothetical protein